MVGEYVSVIVAGELRLTFVSGDSVNVPRPEPLQLFVTLRSTCTLLFELSVPVAVPVPFTRTSPTSSGFEFIVMTVGPADASSDQPPISNATQIPRMTTAP